MTTAYNLALLANNLDTSGRLDATDGLTGATPITNGGTGNTTASAAFNALKQDATDTVTGVVELANSSEASAGTDTTRVITPATLRNGFNASGSAPVYACRAWVNFNGTGTIAIRASGNVSSIGDNGTGDYTVNFTTAMSDANYCIAGGGNRTGTPEQTTLSWTSSTTPTSSAVRLRNGQTQTLYDADYASVAIFR